MWIHIRGNTVMQYLHIYSLHNYMSIYIDSTSKVQNNFIINMGKGALSGLKYRSLVTRVNRTIKQCAIYAGYCKGGSEGASAFGAPIK